MFRTLFAATLALSLGFAVVSCGGGGKKKAEPKPVTWKEVEHLGVSLKVPADFKKNPATGTESVQYMHPTKGLLVYINIERNKMGEDGLDGLYAKEYEKRQRDTRKRLKSEKAYEILGGKKDISLGGKKAFEVEQEFMSEAGDTRAHNIVIEMDSGDGNLVTVKWVVSNVKEQPWEKIFNRYFKNSRASLNAK